MGMANEHKRQPPTVQSHAEQQLRFIRDTMARATAYTMVSGWGGVMMGLIAVGAAAAGTRTKTALEWLIVWLVAAAAALAVGIVMTVRKARRARTPVLSGAGRRFWICLGTPFIVGALLTVALYRHGYFTLLPGVWMLLFGTGVVTGGVFSVRIIPVTGVCFMITGAAALFLPLAWGNILMGVCFGGFQMLFGYIIARHYGG
jgi:hypothetical protein